ncbi:MAG: cation:dicarboxylase symporter family transporter [Clostridia bacterium]|nr:cation:dicarboxylase symporter family transporter [Clostridia bacterium]
MIPLPSAKGQSSSTPSGKRRESGTQDHDPRREVRSLFRGGRTLLFDLVPTNLVDPFLKNNTAQLVILSFLCGAGLLMLGDSVGELKTVMTQISKWVMSVMRIILLLMPAIPFLSIMISAFHRLPRHSHRLHGDAESPRPAAELRRSVHDLPAPDGQFRRRVQHFLQHA